MRVRFDRHAKVGTVIHDRGTEADLPDDVAMALVASGRASLLPKNAPPPQPDLIDQKEPEAPHRTTSVFDYIRKR